MGMRKESKRVLIVATVVKTHIMQFHIPVLKLFKDMGWETAVAARNDYANPEDCQIPYCDQFYDIPFERIPFMPKNAACYRQLKDIIDQGNYQIIHCHTPVGGALGRLAATNARKKGTRVLYTAHGFHFYKGAPLLNWLLYYPVEKWLARYTDALLTINQEDYSLAKRKMKLRNGGKVYYVPGVGIDTTQNKADADLRKNKRSELGLNDDDIALISMGDSCKSFEKIDSFYMEFLCRRL